MDMSRRDLLKLSATAQDKGRTDELDWPSPEIVLEDDWYIQSSVLLEKGGEVVSSDLEVVRDKCAGVPFQQQRSWIESAR